MDFDIKEITFNNPKPARKVEMWLCTAGEDEQQIITDYGHTVLKFIPESKDEDAIVADATYAQYSFDHGIDTYDTYCATKVDNSNAQRILEDALGCCFRDYEIHDENVWQNGRALAVSRTTDNVMYRELDAVGGVQALLEMSEDGFQRATDGILAAVRCELDALRLSVEDIFYRDADQSYMRLESLVEDCAGVGHRAFMRSFERRSRVVAN